MIVTICRLRSYRMPHFNKCSQGRHISFPEPRPIFQKLIGCAHYGKKTNDAIEKLNEKIQAWNCQDTATIVTAQDLQTVEQLIQRKCARCGARDDHENSFIRLLLCACCKATLYCSKTCQTKDWTTHKLQCSRSNTV